MTESDSKQDRMLRKIQLYVALLAGLITLVIGVYNVRNIFFKKPEPVKVEQPAPASAIREAVEEVGAAWIKELASPKKDNN